MKSGLFIECLGSTVFRFQHLLVSIIAIACPCLNFIFMPIRLSALLYLSPKKHFVMSVFKTKGMNWCPLQSVVHVSEVAVKRQFTDKVLLALIYSRLQT